MSSTKTNRRDQFNSILKQFGDYYQEPIIALINLAREKGATNNEIAKTLKVDPALITHKYKAEKGGK